MATRWPEGQERASGVQDVKFYAELKFGKIFAIWFKK
jgi:hypothetical protein